MAPLPPPLRDDLLPPSRTTLTGLLMIVGGPTTASTGMPLSSIKTASRPSSPTRRRPVGVLTTVSTPIKRGAGLSRISDGWETEVADEA